MGPSLVSVHGRPMEAADFTSHALHAANNAGAFKRPQRYSKAFHHKTAEENERERELKRAAVALYNAHAKRQSKEFTAAMKTFLKEKRRIKRALLSRWLQARATSTAGGWLVYTKRKMNGSKFDTLRDSGNPNHEEYHMKDWPNLASTHLNRLFAPTNSADHVNYLSGHRDMLRRQFASDLPCAGQSAEVASIAQHSDPFQCTIDNSTVVYTDARFDATASRAGAAAVFLCKGSGHPFVSSYVETDRIIALCTAELQRSYHTFDNITAEPLAAVIAIELIFRLPTHPTNFYIVYHDCMLVEQATTGEIRHGKRADLIGRLISGVVAASRRNIEIIFLHVKAHRRDEWNEQIDRTAKNKINLCPLPTRISSFVDRALHVMTEPDRTPHFKRRRLDHVHVADFNRRDDTGSFLHCDCESEVDIWHCFEGARETQPVAREEVEACRPTDLNYAPKFGSVDFGEADSTTLDVSSFSPRRVAARGVESGAGSVPHALSVVCPSGFTHSPAEAPGHSSCSLSATVRDTHRVFYVDRKKEPTSCRTDSECNINPAIRADSIGENKGADVSNAPNVSAVATDNQPDFAVHANHELSSLDAASCEHESSLEHAHQTSFVPSPTWQEGAIIDFSSQHAVRRNGEVTHESNLTNSHAVQSSAMPPEPTVDMCTGQVENVGDDVDVSQPVSLQCMLDSIAATATQKAAGPDGINSELIRWLPISHKLYLLQIINMIFKGADFPSEWNLSEVYLVFKNQKENTIQNHRPITVDAYIKKLVEVILFQKSETFLKQLPTQIPYFFGFDQMQSTDLIFILRRIAMLSRSWADTQDLFICKLDIASAFDNLDSKALVGLLESTGMPPCDEASLGHPSRQ